MSWFRRLPSAGLRSPFVDGRGGLHASPAKSHAGLRAVDVKQMKRVEPGFGFSTRRTYDLGLSSGLVRHSCSRADGELHGIARAADVIQRNAADAVDGIEHVGHAFDRRRVPPVDGHPTGDRMRHRRDVITDHVGIVFQITAQVRRESVTPKVGLGGSRAPGRAGRCKSRRRYRCAPYRQ